MAKITMNQAKVEAQKLLGNEHLRVYSRPAVADERDKNAPKGAHQYIYGCATETQDRNGLWQLTYLPNGDIDPACILVTANSLEVLMSIVRLLGREKNDSLKK